MTSYITSPLTHKKILGKKTKSYGDVSNVTNFCRRGFEPGLLWYSTYGESYKPHPGQKLMTSCMLRFLPLYQLRHQFTD